MSENVPVILDDDLEPGLYLIAEQKWLKISGVKLEN